MSIPGIEELCCRGLLDPSDCDPNYVRTNANNTCDSYIYSYCKTAAGKNDTLCACINSEIPSPDCHDAKCRSSGAFMPKNMIAQPCPTMINCNQYVNMTGEVQSSLVNVAQYQICGTDLGGNKVDSTLPAGASVNTANNQQTDAVKSTSTAPIEIPTQQAPPPPPPKPPTKETPQAAPETTDNSYMMEVVAIVVALFILLGAGGFYYNKKK